MQIKPNLSETVWNLQLEDDFDGEALSTDWLFPRTPEKDGVIISDSRVFIKGSKQDLNSMHAKNILLRRQKDFKFTVDDGMSKQENPTNNYPKIIKEAYQVFECTWVKELDNAQDDKVLEEYNEPYHNFNGVTSKYGAHFILKIDHILLKDKYYNAIVNGVDKKNFCSLPTNWGYRLWVRELWHAIRK